jgi:hypothetical protein
MGTIFYRETMLDIKLLRKDPQGIEAKLKTKDPEIHLGPVLALNNSNGPLINCEKELGAYHG